MLRTLSQKRNINHTRRLLLTMAVGAVAGFAINWITGIEFAHTICALASGAHVLRRVHREEK